MREIIAFVDQGHSVGFGCGIGEAVSKVQVCTMSCDLAVARHCVEGFRAYERIDNDLNCPHRIEEAVDERSSFGKNLLAAQLTFCGTGMKRRQGRNGFETNNVKLLTDLAEPFSRSSNPDSSFRMATMTEASTKLIHSSPRDHP